MCVDSLGLAYAGTAREDVLEILTPLIVEGGVGIEVVSLTCLSLGLIFCGTANDDLSGSMIEVCILSPTTIPPLPPSFPLPYVFFE